MGTTVKLWLSLLFSLTLLSEPGLATTFNPVQPGATNYRASQGPVACGAGFCTTTLVPPGVGSLTPNQATALTSTFDAQFPGFSYAYGGAINALTWNITTYQAVNTGTNAGANFALNLTPAGSVPANAHWVQWVTDNYNITGMNGTDTAAAKGPGQPEDTIDGSYKSTTYAGSPFYDVFPPGDPNAFNTTPPIFSDSPRRPEPTAANPVINWDAWLFLVSAPQTQANAGNNPLVQVTFYDGANWGWQATYSATAPLPSTWILMFAGLGIFGFTMRRRSTPAPA